jgi:hypothetical protein
LSGSFDPEGRGAGVTESSVPGATLEAATRLYDLALTFADRSHAAQAALIREFEHEAEVVGGALGELLIEDADNERLVLTGNGRFEGKVLVTTPGSTWESLSSPDDIVDYYDPVDLFDDLADSIAEAYPGVAARPDGAVAPAVSTDPWFARQAAVASSETTPDGGLSGAAAPAETATMTVLRDLHAAGVYTDAEFEQKMAELERG